MAPYKILKQGYMLKEPPLSKRGIRKRLFRYWFVLVEDRNQVALVYFKSEDAYLARHKNEGFIRVDHSENISVIGEHMGHKNAFVVRTPKGEYHLLPESRYDLHEWLFTLHTALENFKKRMQRNQERKESAQQGQRPRANTMDAQPSRPGTTDAQASRAGTIDAQHKPSATAGHTPPYRRAPPPPREDQGASSTANADKKPSGRRKPVRPAPAAPSGRRRSSTTSGQELSQEVPVSTGNDLSQPLPQETPPPQYSASLPSDEMRAPYEQWMSQEGYGTDQDPFSTLGSGQHMVVDLNITQTDREEEMLPGTREEPEGGTVEEISAGREGQENSQPLPMHVRSASDSMLLHSASNSLPDLINEDSSISPDNPEVLTGQQKLVAGHTRHLSLLGGIGGSFREPRVKQDRGGSRKKKARRANSVKQRSRSPPNLPPPPPPTGPPSRDPPPPPSESPPRDLPPPPSEPLPLSEPFPQDLPPTQNADGDGISGSGFLRVLDTITDIDQQLDLMTHQFSSFKAQPPPTKTGTVADILFQHPKVGQSPAPALGPSPISSDDGAGVSFREEDWLCDLPSAPMEQNGVGPPPVTIPDLTNQVTTNRPKGKHRVMFKDEVEDIPSYEPPVEITTPPAEQEEVPTGVAAIKMKLFGQQEQEVTRYKKEGILSPKYTHPSNMTFSDEYFTAQISAMHHTGNMSSPPAIGNAQMDRETSPNVNNNNSEEGAVVPNSPPAVVNGGDLQPPPATKPAMSFLDDPPEPEQNLYDPPWEQKAVNKVVAASRRSASPAAIKEKSPPPVAPRKYGPKIQFAEVSVKETPKPSATEVRNVHSLERKQHHSTRPRRTSMSPPPNNVMPPVLQGPTSASPPPQDDSLLASISDTLQATSRYGSDSLLSNGDTSITDLQPSGDAGGKRRNSGGTKMSARGELEKIRAAHTNKKESAPIVLYPSPLVQSMPQASHPHQNPGKPMTSQQSMSTASALQTTPLQSSQQGMSITHQQATATHPQVTNKLQSSPQLYKAGSTARGAVGLGIGTAPGKTPRTVTSLDALQRRRDTQVTYDTQTHAHIFRSLV